jgi:hypothetical protein
VSLRLSDTTISAIAQLVQVGMLTGTDIIDNLRTIRLEADGDLLNPTDSFIDGFKRGIEEMLAQAESEALN